MSKKIGSLEVICGQMFSGKTEELIRRVKRALIGKKRVQVFKHSLDIRYGKDKKIFSHNGLSLKTEVVTKARDILPKVHKKTEIVAIDEVQWFGKELIEVIEKLISKEKQIIVSGLSTTFDRQPFDPIPQLMATADKVIKLSAICIICGKEAVFHKRILEKGPKDPALITPLLVGKINAYEARCRVCFEK